ncbi:MAG: TIGR01777 family oxidoreductase [Pseudohongiellaceae bacterium]
METASEAKKNILITGASGMIGRSLTRFLEKSGYQVYALSRTNEKAPFYFDQVSKKMYLSDVIPLFGVINLAGTNISDKRWNPARKKEIISSRESTTELLCQSIVRLKNKPAVLLSASAIGFYGPTGEEFSNEKSPAGNDFLAEVSKRWENATTIASAEGIRTVQLRFGIVLSVTGGVLQNFLLPLRLAVVGPLGSGTQKISWISITDVLRLVRLCLKNPKLSGPLNLVSNNAVSSREFAKTLSKAAARPHLPTIPASIARLMFGEMADAALLASSDVRSEKYEEVGFQLQHPTLEAALTHLLDEDE